jgi:MarR family 2-MHQ and catechol resistance regulon transcriptional repressor
MQKVSGVHVFLVLMKAFRSVAQFATKSIESSHLNDSDFRVLEVLLHKGPLPVNVIGPKVFLTPGSISVAVDRLYEKGLVTRQDCARDRRLKFVNLTAEGRKLIETVFSEHAKQMDELMHVLNKTEREQLVETLKKLGKHAESLQ